MANQKISELTTATNPSVIDVLPIVNGGSTKKITAASFLTNTLSATMVSVSALNVNNNVFFRAKGAAIGIGDQSTGRTIFNSDMCMTESAWNIFLGFFAGQGCNKGTYGASVPPYYNIAIGNQAGRYLGADDDTSCSGRAHRNIRNLLIGNQAGQRLCAGSDFGAACKNVFLGDRSFQSATNRVFNNVSIGHYSGQYLCNGRNNTFIGHRVVGDSNTGGPTNYPQHNVVIGACAGCCLSCNASSNVIIGAYANVNGNAGSYSVRGAVAIGGSANAFRSASVAIGGGAFAYRCGDIVIGHGSRSNTIANNSIIIGRGNFLGTQLSGAIVLGSCNGSNINHSFVLGSPVFPLSARPDTTLTNQVSSLFVRINGENRRIPILI